MTNNIYHYFVEGDCEKKFIDAYKQGEFQFLNSGKVEVINPVNTYISRSRIRSLKQNTIVVLVYDVDKGNIDVLKENLNRFKQFSITKIIHVQSITNFEDEIVFSTNVTKIDDVFGVKGVDNFKTAFIAHKDIANKLKSILFDNTKIWSRVNTIYQFKDFSKESHLKAIRK